VVLTSVAGCILGGTNFGGGRGGVLGGVAGALALVLLGTLLTGLGVPQPFKLILQGLIIAFAAAVAR
jgi:ribose transport system permease protein